jgi:SAM-dependent methyltransferase
MPSRLERAIIGGVPTRARRWVTRTLLRLEQQAEHDALVRAYIAGERRPWSPGYREYRAQYIAAVLADEARMAVFREGRSLPDGHGYRLDERTVEYPWVLSRSDVWGPRVLDAGSTLNDRGLLVHPALAGRELIFYSLAHDRLEHRANVSYITGDLRNTVLRDAVVDVVVCVSTLEHVGLDNTRFYTSDVRYREQNPSDYARALREFRRILTPDGRLLITVPFGRAMRLGWLQQFDAAGVQAIVDEFGGRVVETSYFKYEVTGWVRSTVKDCKDCEYFDIHSQPDVDPGGAAAARAVACLELLKTS